MLRDISHSPAAPEADRRIASPLAVFVVVQHELLRRGIRSVVADDPRMRVVGEAGAIADAVGAIESERPDVVVLDLRLPDGAGGDLSRALRARGVDARFLMLTSDGQDGEIVDAVESGAAGYLQKDAPATEVARAIREVGAGRSLIDPSVAARLLEKARATKRRTGRLTPQEQRILDLLGEGLSNRSIGARLGVAEKTVKNHVSSLLAKLGASNRTEAALIGVRARSGS